MRPKLYRSNHDRILTGLSGGLAEYFQINPTLLRVLLILSIPFTGTTTVLIYIIAALIVPKQPPVYRPFEQNPFHEEYPEDRYGPRQSYGGYWGTSQNAYEPNTYDAPHKSNSRYFGKNRPPQQAPDQTSKSNGDLDSMMEGIENKALRKEVEQLRKKVAQYEKGDL